MIGRISRRAAGGLLVVVLAVGCGGSDVGKVSGKVTYKGTPVTDGTLNLLMKEKGIGAAAVLDAGGGFAVAEPLSVGTYTAYVTATPPVAGPPGSKPVKPAAPKVPRKAGDASTSDARVVVKGGANDVVIEFKD